MLFELITELPNKEIDWIITESKLSLLSVYRVGDRFVIYWQNNDLLHPETIIYNVKDGNPMTPIIKFQQLNSELSHMKNFQEVFKLDLQAVKI